MLCFPISPCTETIDSIVREGVKNEKDKEKRQDIELPGIELFIEVENADRKLTNEWQSCKKYSNSFVVTIAKRDGKTF